MTRVLLAIFAIAAAQGAPENRFRTGVELVQVNVLVTDGNRPISGLSAADFQVRDSGILQDVQAARLADVPLSVTLVLDTSHSVKGETLAQLKAAAIAAVGELGSDDAVSVISFSSGIRRPIVWTIPSRLVGQRIDTLEASGGTSLYDALFAALAAGGRESGNRHLILVFTDGMDTASWLPPSAVLERARRSDAVIYSIVLGKTSDRSLLFRRSGIELLDPVVPRGAATPFLIDLSTSTGGSHHVAESAGALRRLFTRVVAEFRTRYLLTYSPQGVDKTGWHPIEVKLKSQKGKVTARRGYLR